MEYERVTRARRMQCIGCTRTLLEYRLSMQRHDLRRCSIVRVLWSLPRNLLYINNTFWTIHEATSFKATVCKNYMCVPCVANLWVDALYRRVLCEWLDQYNRMEIMIRFIRTSISCSVCYCLSRVLFVPVSERHKESKIVSHTLNVLHGGGHFARLWLFQTVVTVLHCCLARSDGRFTRKRTECPFLYAKI